MNRTETAEKVNRQVLERAAALYEAARSDLRLYDDYTGCQNLVYDFNRGGEAMILRISYRDDRTFELVQAEVDFVNYLADQGVRVSRAVPSQRGDLVERLDYDGGECLAVAFVKGRGMRVPDNGYRYRPGVPIDVYCQDWGRILGQMHRLTKTYRPPNPALTRPHWLDWHGRARVERFIPEPLQLVRERLGDLLAKLEALPRTQDTYGLMHADFNDGNFTLDYDNGDITAFDFDDCCRGWFAYELACAWEGGVGRTMFEPDAGKRRAYMERYFEQVVAGYESENTLPAGWMDLLPTFLKTVEMESLVEHLAYYAENNQPVPKDDHPRLAYLMRCIEEDIPDMGLFDPVFSHERPFELDTRAIEKLLG